MPPSRACSQLQSSMTLLTWRRASGTRVHAKRGEARAITPAPRGRATGAGDLAGEAGGDPFPPHRVAHRGSRSDAGDQFVFLRWQHRAAPRSIVAARIAYLGANGRGF